MGIGTGLAFIAIGAILAFATHFSVNGIDIQMVGWILIFVGIAMLAFTLLYARPRRRARSTAIVEEDPRYVAPGEVEGEPVLRREIIEPGAQPRVPPQQRRDIR